MPHTHARSRQGAGSRRRHERKRALDLLAKQVGVAETGQSALANVDAPPPRWAHELAQELQAENEVHQQEALTDHHYGYVAPIREPWGEATALLQSERDRLTAYRIARVDTEVTQAVLLRAAADAERASACGDAQRRVPPMADKQAEQRVRETIEAIAKYRPVPVRRLRAMLAVDHRLRRQHPIPRRPEVLPCGRDRRRLDTVRDRVDPTFRG